MADLAVRYLIRDWIAPGNSATKGATSRAVETGGITVTIADQPMRVVTFADCGVVVAMSWLVCWQ